MADEMSVSVAIAEPVASWLQPLEGTPAGPDLEYEPEFLELEQAAAGKPETQFSAAEAPQWSDVRERSAALLGRSRDLRLAMWWARATINLDGLPGLLPGLQLLSGLIDTFWSEGLHPALETEDDGTEDAFARISVVGSLDKMDGLLGDVRQALLHSDRRLGNLRVRDTEIALERLAPRSDESPRSLGEIQNMFGELTDLNLALRTLTDNILQQIKQLQTVMNQRFGIGDAVDVKALRVMVDGVKTVLPEPVEASGEGDPAAAGGEGGATGAPKGGGGPPTRIDNRKDAIRAINLVCQFLERSEPTNPAQLLLRRAERLIEKNFMQLVKELAPDAMRDVSRIMGVDPDDYRDD